MPISNEVRRLAARWSTGTGWPQRLNWIEIHGLRGWQGQRLNLQFPIMVIVGENGVGKSTLLQAAASVYRSTNDKRFASDYFPDTWWETIKNAHIRYSVRQGPREFDHSIRKPGQRWRGNPQRPDRDVRFYDLSRMQPVPARVGYTRLVKAHHKEVSATPFDKYRLQRFSDIMGRAYDIAKIAITNIHKDRPVPVLSQQGTAYSGFHQGAGETTVAELLQADLPKYSIVLIDEIESSLHPRAQRRLVRDLADRSREREWQIVMTTHSPYVLSELPSQARAYIMPVGTTREIVYGVSPAFAMTQMDDVPQPECDLYVEDHRAEMLLTEVLVAHAPDLVQRCQLIPFGAASVGKSLGQMTEGRKFPRPSCVYLDGDQASAPGCINIGDDAPEHIVFESLRDRDWPGIAERVGRPFAKVSDACARAMARSDHHEWVDDAATPLVLRGDNLWQAMCAEWAKALPTPEAEALIQPIQDALIDVGPQGKKPAVAPTIPKPEQASKTTPKAAFSQKLPLLELLRSVPKE